MGVKFGIRSNRDCDEKERRRGENREPKSADEEMWYQLDRGYDNESRKRDPVEDSKHGDES